MIKRLLAVSLVISGLGAVAGQAKEVTFYKDVVPVLQNRCQECHRPGEAAPMSLLTYKDTRPWAKAIKQAVASKKMPPWHADPAHGKFVNDRSLTPQEIATLSDWADGGAKEGHAKDAPKPLTFTGGWTIGKPDVIIGMPHEFKLPASGTVEYTWFVVPSGFTEDKWVEKIEVRPGNRSVVHHVVLIARAPGAGLHKDAKPGVAFVPPGRKSPPERRPDTGAGTFSMLANAGVEMVSVYVPGGVAYTTKPGQARLIKAGSDLMFQMHYTPNGKETVDRTQAGFIFAKEPPKERVVNTFIMNGNLRIPAGAPEHKVEARVTVHEDVKIASLFPHMHVRGKSFEYKAIYPTGETQTLLRVPKYDFNWQLTYYFDRELTLPKGTQIHATAWYDNSANNPYNPDPKSEVFWGDQTWEEMLAGFVDFVIPVNVNPGDIARPKKPVTQASLQE